MPFEVLLFRKWDLFAAVDPGYCACKPGRKKSAQYHENGTTLGTEKKPLGNCADDERRSIPFEITAQNKVRSIYARVPGGRPTNQRPTERR